MDMNENSVPMTMPVMPSGGAGGMFGNDSGWWIILLFILLGGWGGGFGANNGMNQMYPWMNNSQQINDGFRDQFMNSQIVGLQAGLNDIQNAITQQGFAMQSQLAQCCCNNNLATVQTQNIVQQEGAATRLAIQNQTQAILDRMCQQEIDALKSQNAALQAQVNMLNLAASQTAQTAALVADNTAQTNYLISKLTPAATT